MKYTRIPWKKNHKCEHPQRIIFYATEATAYPTHPGSNEAENRLTRGFATAWIWYKNSWQPREHIAFTESAEFWRFAYDFARQRKPVWAYTYNAGFNFTLLSGWSEIDAGRLRIFEAGKPLATRGTGGQNYQGPWRGKTALDGIPFILETRSDRGPIKFVDSLNYWNESIGDMSRWTGIRLPSSPFDSESERDYATVCESTVRIIEKAILSLLDLWQREQLGNWQPTAASLAFSSYRHGKEKSQIIAHGDDDGNEDQILAAQEILGTNSLLPSEITSSERRSYYGGRTSVYFRGTLQSGFPVGDAGQGRLFHVGREAIHGPITVLDVNSLYPFVMKEFPHPVELYDSHKTVSLALATQLVEAFPCVADVEIDSDEAPYPYRVNAATSYCTGNFATTLCGPELAAAICRKHTKCIANLSVYFAGRPFGSFVEHWYQKRTTAIGDGRDIDARFCKLIMNSLYGKFAQKSPLWQTCGHIVPPVRWGGFISSPGNGEPPCIMRAIGGVSQYQSTPKNCRHTFVAVAGSITSWARVHMQSLIDCCPAKSIVYMDTDSLFCLPQAVSALKTLGLIHPTELGKLKVKGEYSRVVIHGLKDYELDGKRTIAGLKVDSEELSNRIWQQINYEGVKQVIQHDPDGSVMQKWVRFAPSATIPGHSVDGDGWCKPLRVDQWQSRHTNQRET